MSKPEKECRCRDCKCVSKGTTQCEKCHKATVKLWVEHCETKYNLKKKEIDKVVT